MTSRLTAALTALALVFVPGLARAQQPAPVVHAGVDVDALTPRGLVRMDATVPAAADVPVRVTFASQPGAPNELVVGVVVARDAAAARAAMERFYTGVQHEVPRDASVGDVAMHLGSELVAFRRDNVFVWVRKLSGRHDVDAVARTIDAVIVASPAGGETRAAAVGVQVGARIASSDRRLAIYTLTPAAGALAVEVRARRAGLSAYHTSRGWFVRARDPRVAPQAGDFVVRAVDSRLRVTGD